VSGIVVIMGYIHTKGVDYRFDTPIHDGIKRVTGFCEIIGWFSVFGRWEMVLDDFFYTFVADLFVNLL
jgi:hypothetical protein